MKQAQLGNKSSYFAKDYYNIIGGGIVSKNKIEASHELFIKRWSKINKNGYIKYVGPRVFLCTIFGAVGGLLTLYLSYLTWDHSAFNSLAFYVIFASIGTTIAGGVSSNSSWKTNEKRYSKIILKRQDS